MKEQIIPILEELLHAPSPTGFTEPAAAVVEKHLKEAGLIVSRTPKGSIVADLGEGEEGLILAAHIDTLGLMVRTIYSDGTLGMTRLGGYPYLYVEGENVLVHTLEGKTYEATVRHVNPSVHANQKIDELPREESSMRIVLDEEVFDKESVKKLGIRHGDPVSLDVRYRHTPSGYIKSRHLDDKASAAILLALAKDLKAQTFRPLRFFFSVYEEVGHGASAANDGRFTEFLAVDMGVVGEDLSTREEVVSICRKDSSGPYDYAMTKRLIQLAEEKHLPHALDIYPFYGSDASAALRGGADLRCALIGPGVASSHGYERTHEKALFATYDLILAYLEKMKE